MKKTIIFRSFTFLLLLIVAAAIEDDVKCLQGVKKSLQDPNQNLESWVFTNISVSFICKQLNGVSCWNEQESRIISLQLPSMGLAGQIPESLQYCRSLQSLELPGNDLSGSIPTQICNWLPYLTTLDLSSNRFSGQIPPEIANCRFLNNLILNDNQFSGRIPYGLGQLDRIRKFSVANNALTGLIPSDLNKYPSEDFSGNNGLCGESIGKRCGKLSSKSLAIIIAAGVLGAAGSILLAFGVWWWCILPSQRKKRKGYEEKGNWIQRLRSHRLLQVTLFQKPIVKVKLNDLMAATNNFDPENIVNSTKTGESYKAVLSDGSTLSIKRLTICKLNQKQFKIEMHKLGQLRHSNLVPLLGFCLVEDEKLLVYKHMPNGSLHSLLHTSTVSLDWPTRLRIAIGSARGLAWLHHGSDPPYIHQYISSNVILLDDDMEPRVTDFGLSRLLCSGSGSVSGHDSNDCFGELGYIAPEFSGSSSVRTTKSDVYSFGVVLLELVTGEKGVEVGNGGEGFKGNLVDWVSQLTVSGRAQDAIDKRLLGRGYDNEMVRFFKLGSSCVASRPKERPSLYSVYESLKTMGEQHGFSEQINEFPAMNYGKLD
ncbi:probable inactive receptor kinase At1g27190 [Impatiens glandulifera]|uniref:probable inactive receptor kinase At1g27190 n=1 Tax=Impatiens glandulifera TaxID=253017 RepID=UPI001FB130AD|nr:probable inactive receptor kinase At1g27190 [Impatiens glandulifera]